MRAIMGFIAATILTAATFLASLEVYAESTLVTSKGTFKCANACVVDNSGNVSDSAGGHVWKLMVGDNMEP
jgi:hypothetical protein